MSSYLNFYLVPKKKENDNKEQDPLLLFSYSRSCDIYQAYSDNLNPVYVVNDDKIYHTELTEADALSVVESVEKDLKRVKTGLENRIHAYKELPNLSQEVINNFMDDYTSTHEYIKELEDTIKELQFIANIVTDVSNDYTDFEKVLINID